ncbi:Rrf2-linked NADH-flavin reductase [Streptococcus sp. DD10]|uniref:NAD(P)-dependent oxidoreductase n=1 Tax=Streptococcus sp. DD10 TaxID=1777878 RepID=UPI0007970D17|nr:NAD(P)-dependent oxidoreductase [Streptococcus sp. DD10]KXT74366.1 Rrf2-linked NADH-flavin reductase [Streptococcus sp. DD10]
MKIAVIAANGQAGRRIVAEAIHRGHDVTAIVRTENQTKAEQVIQKDLFNLTKEDLVGFDVVVSAFGAFTPETLPLHSQSIHHFDELLSGSETRLLIVGGAGSLYLDESLTTRLLDTPDFPEEFKPLASAQAEELDVIRTKKNLQWTFVSPAADFVIEGERTGDYILAGEIFATNKEGISQLSYDDYAIAMVDEIEGGKHIQERISILGR